MKGLLIKDIRLLKGQSTILLALLVLVAVFMGVGLGCIIFFCSGIYNNFSLYLRGVYHQL